MNHNILDENRLNEILEESVRAVLEDTPPSVTGRLSNSIPEATQPLSGMNSLPLSSIIQSVIHEIPNMLNDLSLNHSARFNESNNLERPTLQSRDYQNSIDLVRSLDFESAQPEPENPINTNRDQYSSNTTNYNTNASSNSIDLQRRNTEMLDDFIASWFRHTRDYNDQMRLYHQNILQMVRVSQNLTRILQGLFRSRSSEMRDTPINNAPNTIPINSFIPSNITDIFARNGVDLNVDIQGFSVPISRRSEVNVHPTIAQIFEGTDRYNYTPDRMRDISTTRCPISLEDFQLGDELCEIKHCHHIFKWRSLQSWFSRNSHCPVCRYDITEYTSSSSP